jgi:hypothetical protein
MRISCMVSSMRAQIGHPVLALARKRARGARTCTMGATTSGTPASTSRVSLSRWWRQHDQPADQQQRLRSAIDSARTDHILDLRGVVGQPRNHLAGAPGLEKGRRQRQQVVEDPAPQVGRYPLAQPGHVVEARVGGRREQRDDAEHHQQRCDPARPGRRPRSPGRSPRAQALPDAPAWPGAGGHGANSARAIDCPQGACMNSLPLTSLVTLLVLICSPSPPSTWDAPGDVTASRRRR